ncbi:hypothetical protein HWN77_28290, partial [Escherichia coli]|uniref:hypothetical protein n=1 Tax=Escherichia coli TaxID=562 RepID=UPI0017F93AF9
MKSFHVVRLLSPVGRPVAGLVACGSSKDRSAFVDETDGGGTGFGEAGLAEGGTKPGIGGRDPVTCDEAAQFKTYVGCDYWPTVTDNVVDDIFD